MRVRRSRWRSVLGTRLEFGWELPINPNGNKRQGSIPYVFDQNDTPPRRIPRFVVSSRRTTVFAPSAYVSYFVYDWIALLYIYQYLKLTA